MRTIRTVAAPAVAIALSVSTVAAAPSRATPAEILADSDGPAGFELASDELVEQDFVEFSRLSPYSVGHVQPGSAEADAMVAGIDLWALNDEDETLLREVVRWSSSDVALGYRREVSTYAIGDSLEEVDPPFENARAFSGDDPVMGVWVRMVVWVDGPYGAAITHFSSQLNPSSDVVDDTARRLAERIDAATSGNDDDDGAQSDVAADDESDAGGGGIPLTTVLLFVAVIGGAIWLFLRFRKRLAAAKGRGGTLPPTTKERTASEGDRDTDDIIEEARRRARKEVDQTSEQWQVPDDY